MIANPLTSPPLSAVARRVIRRGGSGGHGHGHVLADSGDRVPQLRLTGNGAFLPPIAS